CRAPVEKWTEISEFLGGHTSGLAVPEFVVDMPGGGGKVPLAPNYLLSHSDKKGILRNYKGFIGSYPQPTETDCSCSTTLAVGEGTFRDEGGTSHLLPKDLGLDPTE